VSGKRYKKRQIIPSRQEKPSPVQTNESTGVTAKIQAEYFSGPLPPPSLLARYNDLIPNGAERILAMAERQSAHRESMEAQVVTGNLAIQKQGAYLAFILSLVIILGGIFLMCMGKDAYGFASIVTSIAGLASAFIYSKHEQRKERTEKAAALDARRHR
jgi:uncharacterized membrane protein